MRVLPAQTEMEAKVTVVAPIVIPILLRLFQEIVNRQQKVDTIY